MRLNLAILNIHRLRRRVNDTGVADDCPHRVAPSSNYSSLRPVNAATASSTSFSISDSNCSSGNGLRDRLISCQTVRSRLREHGRRPRRPYLLTMVLSLVSCEYSCSSICDRQAKPEFVRKKYKSPSLSRPGYSVRNPRTSPSDDS